MESRSKREVQLDEEESRVHESGSGSREEAQRMFERIDESGPGSGFGVLGRTNEFVSDELRTPPNGSEAAYRAACAEAEEMLREVEERGANGHLGVLGADVDVRRLLEFFDQLQDQLDRVKRNNRLLWVVVLLVTAASLANGTALLVKYLS
jgi:hypothetical protein